MSSKDWIIEDSEDEADMTVYDINLLRTQTTVAATVSRKTSPAVQTPSPQEPVRQTEHTIPSSVPAAQAVVPPIPARPRPRPRPAYAGAPGWKPAEDNTDTAQKVLQIRKASVSGPPTAPASDPGFSVGVAERAKGRHRSSPASKRDGIVDREYKEVDTDSANLRKPEAVIDLSADSSPTRAGPSRLPSKIRKESSLRQAPAGCTEKRPDLSTTPSDPLPPSDPLLPSSSMSAQRVPISPIFDAEVDRRENTPPSSPFATKNKKRKRRDCESEDGEYIGEGVPPMARIATKERSANTKKEKKKERPSKAGTRDKHGTKDDKEREKRRNAPSASKSSSSKGQQEFKSKEIIQESDDELSMSKTSSTNSFSDPSTACTSVNPSLARKNIQEGNKLIPVAQVIVDIPTLPRSDISLHEPAAVRHAGSSKSKSRQDSDEVNSSSRKKGSRPNKKVEGDVNSSDPPGEGTRLADVINEQQMLVTKTSTAMSATKRGGLKNDRKRKRVVESDDEDEAFNPVEKSPEPCTPARPQSTTKDRERAGKGVVTEKENTGISSPASEPAPVRSTQIPPTPTTVPTIPTSSRAPFSSNARFSSQGTSSRRTSMSDLIRRVSAKTNSPLASPSPACPSPLTKSSRVILSRIAPLHANRRTPPPPPPKLPAPKKSKKMLELEEKWEMELAETIEGWSVMSQEERAMLMRQKRDMELGYDD